MSFEFDISPIEAAGARTVADVGADLQALFAKRRTDAGLTMQDVADKLGVDRSRVHRCLSGHNNLTLATLGELIHALGGTLLHEIVPSEEKDEWKLVRVVVNKGTRSSSIGSYEFHEQTKNVCQLGRAREARELVLSNQVEKNLQWK